MNPLVIAALGVGALVLLTGGGSKTAQPSLPREPDSGGGGGGGGGGGSGKPPRPDDGGGVVGGGGGGTPSGESSGTYIARRLQRVVNLYAEARGFYEWTPLAVDGIIGRNTRAAISVVLWSIADFYPGAPQPPGVVMSGNDVTRVTDASSLANYIERYANTQPEGAPPAAIPMDDLRGYLSMALGAERDGEVATAAEIYREVIRFAPEGSDLWREASSRLAALRMRHGSGV